MNGRVYDPLLGRFLQADPFVQAPYNLQSYNRYSYVMNNPLGLTDPSGFSWLDHFVTRWATGQMLLAGDFGGAYLNNRYAYNATQNPYVRMVGAAVAAYYTFGAAYAYTGSQVAAGAAAGFASGGIQGGNVQSAVYGAVTGAFSSYLSGGTSFGNPIEAAGQLGNAVVQGDFAYVGNSALRYLTTQASGQLATRAAGRLGMRPEALNIALMSLSVIGNEVLDGGEKGYEGSRFRSNDRSFASTQGVGFRGYGNRGIVGYFFDTVDAVLAFQGKPTASLRDFAYSAYAGAAVTGHSLGTLDASYALSHGLASRAELYSVPFGNVAPSGANVRLGNFDPVSGGFLGHILNWGASSCAIGASHAFSTYVAAGC